MKSKLKIILPVLLIALGGVYKFVLAKPAAVAKPKIDGQVYVMPKDFLINLADGRFAKVDVGLIFKPGFSAAPAGGGESAAAKPPDGYGDLSQEAVLRDIVTDTITGSTQQDLTSHRGRVRLKAQILDRIDKTTDVKVADVLFMDVAVQ
ncbi:MAG TPA: flagellar basal body-associated FliL family protein [Solirubrobacteraceae bacterium]|jgi:flagellar FliL protein|nr:flagellar basal body-associated FliL family protein [Solirubrobacteraceae bacterium]